ncbi:Bug family tripartite tricarboxylate transporter substrate binding protein [Halorubrum vacuolatum]|uniref:Tripartite-type tricarboxylate transporter, receptor component TctC n=1 Tax=Halorubrum vacuolatum TaxID=63740 RepID=A0A238WIX1_HALVU|nr:tripartite tricarboxylate transporter substrate-binding protein [Halorubrum vacuolatum]SNR46271.1 Tripartite-type tricarboxylate transporter, receptor component TctC [Halorubrum vacuolatum]
MSSETNKQGPNRRRFIKYTGAASTIGIAGLAGCADDDDAADDAGADDAADDTGEDDFPTQDIRYIIPFGEGGGTDTYARQMVPEMDDRLDVNIAIENISGAASLRGTGEAFNSEPDGHTLCAFNPPSTPVSEMVNPQDFELPDMEGVCTYARTPFVIVANSDYEIEGYNDLMDRYEDGDLEVFSGKERGGVDHVMALLMQELHGLNWDTYVGYDGTGPAVQATISDEVPACIATDTGSEAGVEDGSLDLVVSLVSEEAGGTNVFPDLEDITELGYENIDFISNLTRGIYAPPDTPADRRQVIADVVEEALATDAVQEWSEDTGNVVEFGDGDFADQVLQDAYEIIPENVDLEEVREAAAE